MVHSPLLCQGSGIGMQFMALKAAKAGRKLLTPLAN
jgi:hypothetical protein